MPRTAKEPTWIELLNEVRQYLADHEGRAPKTSTPDLRVRALFGWWQAQKIAYRAGRLGTGRTTAVADTLRFARELQAEAYDQARQRTTKNRQNTAPDARAAARAAGRRQARLAAKMLTSPYLVDGDREALQLRIDHPDASMAELAAIAGTNRTRFAGKLRGALTRRPTSRENGRT